MTHTCQIGIDGENGTGPVRCSKHKKDGMVDVKGRRCGTAGCSRKPVCGVAGRKPTRCLEHRSVDIVCWWEYPPSKMRG